MLPSNSSAAPFDGGGGSYAQKIPFKVFIRDPNNQNAWVIASCVPVHVRKLTEGGALDNSWQYDVNPGGEQDYNEMVNDNYRVPYVRNLIFPPTDIVGKDGVFRGQYHQTVGTECLSSEINDGNQSYMNDLGSTLGSGLKLPSFADRFGNGTVISSGITGYRVNDDGTASTRKETTGPSRALPDGTYRIFTDARKDGITRFNEGTTAKNWINSAFNGEDRLKGSIEIEIKDGELQNLPSGGYYSLFLNETSDKSVWERLGISNPIEAALKTVFGGLMNGLEKFIGYMITAIDKMLNWTETQALNNSIKTVNTNMRNLGISFLVIILVLIAFTNALQIRVDQYGINRMIPKIIIAIIMAYFSWIIVQFFFDLAAALQGEAQSIVGSKGDWSTMFSGGSGLDGVVGIGNMIFVIIIFVIAVIIVGALLFSLLIRTVLLAFLIAVAPLAMIMSILPFSERWYKKWWSEFFKWLFMGPLVVFLLALGTVLAGGTPPTLNGASVVSGSGDTFIGLLMMLGAMIFAASLPVTLGGKIMQQWRGAGKGARDYLANRGFERLGKLGRDTDNKWLRRAGYLAPDTAKSYWRNRQQLGKTRREEAGKDLQARLANKEGRGQGVSRFAAGASDKYEVQNLKDQAMDREANRSFAGMDYKDINKSMLDARKRGDKYSEQMHLKYLSKEGKLGTGLNASEDAIVQQMVDEYAPKDGSLQRAIDKEHNEYNIGSSNEEMAVRGSAASTKKGLNDLSVGQHEKLGKLHAIGDKNSSVMKPILGKVDKLKAAGIKEEDIPTVTPQQLQAKGLTAEDALTEKELGSYQQHHELNDVLLKTQETKKFKTTQEYKTEFAKAKQEFESRGEIVSDEEIETHVLEESTFKTSDGRELAYGKSKHEKNIEKIWNNSHQTLQGITPKKLERTGQQQGASKITGLAKNVDSLRGWTNDALMTEAKMLHETGADYETISRIVEVAGDPGRNFTPDELKELHSYTAIANTVNLPTNGGNGGGSGAGGAATTATPRPTPPTPSGGGTATPTPPPVAPGPAPSPTPTPTPSPSSTDYSVAPTVAPSQVITQAPQTVKPASYDQRISALPVGLRPKSGRTLTEEDLSLLENMLRKRPTTHEERVQEKSDILKKGVDPSDGVLDTLDWLQGPTPSQQPPVDSIKPTDTGSDNVNGPEE